MKYKHLFIFCLLGIIMSCANGQDSLHDDANAATDTVIDRGNRVPVKFYSSNVSIASSRAIGEAFETGDAIGISVVNKGETLTDTLKDSGNYADNLEYRLQGVNGFEPMTTPIWQYDKMKLDLVYYAVYPYMENMTPRFTFSARADQSSHTDYTLSDLSCQKKESKQLNVSLELKHMMSKIVVRLHGSDLDQNQLSVSLTNMMLNANVNLNAMEVTATGDATPLIKCEENTTLATSAERVFHAIIAPQQLTTASAMVITNGSNAQALPLPRACRITSGKQWTLNYDIDITADGYIYISFGGDEEGGQHVDSRRD